MLLDIRKDVKKMNKKLTTWKIGSPTKTGEQVLKDQKAHRTKQVNELKSSVSKFESQNKEHEMETDRLEAQARRDNLRFMGSMIKVMILGRIGNQIDEHFNIKKASIQIERARRFRDNSMTHYSEVLAL